MEEDYYGYNETEDGYEYFYEAYGDVTFYNYKDDMLREAIKLDDLKAVENLVETYPTCIRDYDNDPMTQTKDPILLRAKSPEMVSLLLTHGADVSNKVAFIEDYDLLTDLCECQYHEDIFIAMLAYGVDTSHLEKYDIRLHKLYPSWTPRVNWGRWSIYKTVKAFRSIFKERANVVKTKEKTLQRLVFYVMNKSIPTDILEKVFSYL